METLTAPQQRAYLAVCKWLDEGNRGIVLVTGDRRSGKSFVCRALARREDVSAVILNPQTVAPILSPTPVLVVLANPPRSASGDWVAKAHAGIKAGTVKGLVVSVSAKARP